MSKKSQLKREIRELKSQLAGRKTRRRASPSRPKPSNVVKLETVEKSPAARERKIGNFSVLTGTDRARLTRMSQRVFRAATPMPGVLPSDEKVMLEPQLKLACDSAAVAMDEQVADFGGWAQAGMGYGAFAEGQEFLGYPYLATLAQRPEYRVLSEIPASEMTRKWIKIKSKSDDGGKAKEIKLLEEELKRLKVTDAFGRAAEYDGFMGRHHLFLDVGGEGEDLNTPIGDGKNDVTKQKVKRGDFKRIQSVEAVWTYPTWYNANNPLDPTWYSPQTWYVMGKSIHCSRLLTFVGREVPDLLKPAYAFGGLSTSQIAKPYVDNWLRTRQSTSDLVKSFTLWVLKSNLMSWLQPGNEGELAKRAKIFTEMRDNKGFMMLDKETEEIANVAVSLASLDQLQAQSQEQMASVGRIPLVKLLGISPHGLNASSEGEIRTFYDTINATQPKLLGPNFDRVFYLAQVNLWGEIDEDLVYEWVPLHELNEKERAEVEKVKADTDAVHYELGAVDSVEIRQRVASDPNSLHPGLDLNKEIVPPETLSTKGIGLGQGGGVGGDPENSFGKQD